MNKANKHIVLLVAVILAATDISIAQSYINTPNDTLNITGMMEDLETLNIRQLNNSTNTINLKWKKVSESVPANWEASVCDNTICYTSLVDSGTMNPVIPGDYGFILLHITPHVNYGTAIVRYAVWDITNDANKDTLTYILTVNETSGIDAAANKKNFSIYPNPANNNIYIISNLQSGFEFLITDIAGKKMMGGIAKENSIAIITTNFPNGIYNISVIDNNKKNNTKKIILQH